MQSSRSSLQYLPCLNMLGNLLLISFRGTTIVAEKFLKNPETLLYFYAYVKLNEMNLVSELNGPLLCISLYSIRFAEIFLLA